MWRTISNTSNTTTMMYIYMKCIPLNFLTKDWPLCNDIHFQKKIEYQMSFYIIGVYRYIMVNSLIIWCNGIHLLTHTLHCLIACQSKKLWSAPYQFIKRIVCCKNTAKSFCLSFNSKWFDLIAKFSVLIHAALVLPDLKTRLKMFSVFKSMTLTLYNLWYLFWHGFDDIIDRFYGVAQKCIFNSFHKLCISLFLNGMFDCITT